MSCSTLTITLFFFFIRCVSSEAQTTFGISRQTRQLGDVTTQTPTPSFSTTTRRPLFPGVKLPCTCEKGECGCCSGVFLERFRQKICANVSFIPEEFAINARLLFNDRVLYQNTVSGRNPPPLCARLPRFRFITVCLKFSNIYLAQRNVHMCMGVEASWQDLTLFEFSFDCLRLGADGVAVVNPADGGGLPGNPIDSEEQTDEDYDDSAREEPDRPASPALLWPNCFVINNSIIVKRLPNNEFLISFRYFG